MSDEKNYWFRVKRAGDGWIVSLDKFNRDEKAVSSLDAVKLEFAKWVENFDEHEEGA